jgi:general secretion pathway protein E
MNAPQIEPEHRIGYGFAKHYGLLLGERRDGATTVYYRTPLSLEGIKEVRRFVGGRIQLQATTSEEFEHRLSQHFQSGTDGAAAMMADLGDDLDLATLAEHMPEPADLLEAEDDAPIIRLLNALLSQAIKENASDIHIEPFENRLSVRFRVDGVLREVLEPPRNLAPLVASRIKVMADLDIAEKRLPQDGRISLRIGGRPVDVRVSTLPSGHGERVVLRLLDKQAGRLRLEHLGMARKILEGIDELIHRPHGIFLVTGPTGSGKTTTLYAALTRLNDHTRNILTVEDPIEYFFDGIGQTQVNTKVDMSFARGLRAILRQDPDVVMVGEIRDIETARIAVQASLTGHLVFSTLHTNTAVGAVARLRDMGVEPFLLATSLIGVLAQRLVRTLCPDCKEPYTPNEVDLSRLGAPASEVDVLYGPKGCPACGFTGYRGRTGVHEFMAIEDEVRYMIHDGASEPEIERAVHKRWPSIFADGAAKVVGGRTSLEELLRVTSL